MPHSKVIVLTMFLLWCSVTAVFAVNQTYTITVKADSVMGSWNHFYENGVATCHAKTFISTYFGRSVTAALRKGVAEAGFSHVRCHGFLNDDIGLYSETGGVATYNWTNFDRVIDSIKSAGAYPMVEFDFMPGPLSSNPSAIGTNMWYNNANPNIAPPKDYNKWRDLCKAIVQHVEGRYGVDEVRRNWYFEVWNEPMLSKFFSGTTADYYKLYDYAAEGVVLADSLCRIGGPAACDGQDAYIGQFLNHVLHGPNAANSGRTGTKCDFVSYHSYSQSAGGYAAASQASYTNLVLQAVKNANFRGKVLNDEWGVAWDAAYIAKDKENSGSHAAKAIHLVHNTCSPIPEMYAYWTLSDLYEETNSNLNATAFNSNYGMLLRGDASIPESWEVPKAVFNVHKLLHKLGDRQIRLSGGLNQSGGVNGFAVLSGDSAVQVVLYNHVDGDAADPNQSDSVRLTINNIPFASTQVRVEQWTVDRNHCNAYWIWNAKFGSPSRPNAAQWKELRDSAQLKTMVPPAIATLTGKSFTKGFRLNTYGVTMVQITMASGTSAASLRGNPLLLTPALHGSMPLIVIDGSPAKATFAGAGIKVYSPQGRLLGNWDKLHQGTGRNTYVVIIETR
jgi:xylan 1,4-beta-xylosidase